MKRNAPPVRLFVTGTDTGVGKTQVSCALLSLLADRRLKPAPMKPYETGCADLSKPEDALRMHEAARSDDPLELVCPHRYRLPLAPGVAAQREKRPSEFRKTLKAFAALAPPERSVVVEGAGGLLVPVDRERDVVDVIAELDLPVVLVGRAGLGTLNHVGLSLEALERRRIPVLAVVLSRGAARPADPSERDNARVLHERHGVRVLGPVPFVPDESRRRAAFRKVLRPLVDELTGA